MAIGFAHAPIGLMIVAMDETAKALNPVVVFQAARDHALIENC